MTEGVVQAKGKEKVVEGGAASPDDGGDGGELQDDRLQGGEESLQPDSEEEVAPSCGICLCELLERGRLDSCDHVFCFDCIWKWSKVESRCPMCKRRFTRIKKEELGSDDGQRGSLTVQRCFRIPSRNQTYQVPEEELQAFQDPYATTVCLACGAGTDDALMLLCDGCDGAYHTYCVGFGQQVPLGAFYCTTCQAAATTPMQLEDFCTDDDDLRDSDYDASEDGIVPSTSATRPARPARVLRSQRASTARTVGTSRARGGARRRGVNRASRLRVFVGAIRRQRRGTSRRLQEVLQEPVLQQAVVAPRSRETAAHTLVDRMREQWQSIRQGQLQFSDVTARPTSSLTSRRQAAVRQSAEAALPANPRMSSDEARAWAIADQLRARAAAASQRDAAQQPTTSRSSADIRTASTSGTRRSLSSLGPSNHTRREGSLRSPSHREQDLDAGHPSSSHRDYQFHTENLYRGARRSPRGRHAYSRPESAMQPAFYSRGQVLLNQPRQQLDTSTEAVPTPHASGGVHARGAADTAIAATVQASTHRAAGGASHNTAQAVAEPMAGGSPPAVSTAERKALKERIAKLVKQAMLPLYQSKRMDRDAFKQTAKDATHAVLHKALYRAERTDAVLETLVRQALAPTLDQFEL